MSEQWKIEEQSDLTKQVILKQLSGCGKLLGISAFKTDAYADVIAVMLPNDKETANARLIAAAPNLLAACEKAKKAIYLAINGNKGELSHAWHDLDAKIAKAKPK